LSAIIRYEQLQERLVSVHVATKKMRVQQEKN